MKPIAQIIGVENPIDPPHIVAIHEKILMPVGTAITIVAATKYAFMFTAGLRFIPDFIEENKAVSEAQACRGLAVKGNFFKQVKRYMSIVRPLMLRSLGRSETMALSLELRGFGGSKRTFMESVAPKGKDFAVMALTVLLTAFVIYGRVKLGL